jgi:hypothetical protein
MPTDPTCFDPWREGDDDQPPRTAFDVAADVRRRRLTAPSLSSERLYGRVHDAVLVLLVLAIAFALLVLYAELAQVGPFATPAAASTVPATARAPQRPSARPARVPSPPRRAPRQR